MILGARARISCDALKHNFNILKRTTPGCKVMATVKANAYGHDVKIISQALEDVDGLAVARISEILDLRDAGIDKSIILMPGIISDYELNVVFEKNSDLVVHNTEQISLLKNRSQGSIKVWLKIDTGMNRLGVRPRQVRELIHSLRSIKCVREIGLMTHLANADNINDHKTIHQKNTFLQFTDKFDGDISIANSAALLGWQPEILTPKKYNNNGDFWIRPGISLYGISPFTDKTSASLGLQPVMKFEADLIDIKSVSKGDSVGYGGTWTFSSNSNLGIISVGYGDGYSRYLPSGTPVLLNDRKVTLVGLISMDLAAVDLGLNSGDKIGDKVILWGKGLPVEEIAAYAKTTSYTLVCGLSQRVERIID